MRRPLAFFATGVFVFACSGGDDYTPESNGANGELESFTEPGAPRPSLGVGTDVYVALRRHERGETTCEERGCGGEHCVTPRRLTAVTLLSVECRDEGCEAEAGQGVMPGRLTMPTDEPIASTSTVDVDAGDAPLLDLSPRTHEDRVTDRSAGTAFVRLRATTVGPKRVAVRARLEDGELVEDEFLFRAVGAALRVVEGRGEHVEGPWFDLDDGSTPFVVGARLTGCGRVGADDLTLDPHLSTLETATDSLTVSVEGEGVLSPRPVEPGAGCFSIDADAPGKAAIVLRAGTLERRIPLEVVGEREVRAVELWEVPQGRAVLEARDLARPGGLTTLPPSRVGAPRRLAVILRLHDGRAALGTSELASAEDLRITPVRSERTPDVTPYLEIPATYAPNAAVRVAYGEHVVVVPAAAR